MRILSEEAQKSIAETSGIDPDVIRSWYKEFLSVCPKGKMVILSDTTNPLQESCFYL